MKQFDAKPHPGGGSWGAPARSISDFVKEVTSEDEEVLLATGFESAFMGVGRQFSKAPFAVYDRRKCIASLIEEGMDESEAEEYFQFNVQGAWVGDNTPVFVEVI